MPLLSIIFWWRTCVLMHSCMANQEHIYIYCPWYDRVDQYYDKYVAIAFSAVLSVSNQQMPFRWVVMTVFVCICVCVCVISVGIRSSRRGGSSINSMWMKFNELYLLTTYVQLSLYSFFFFFLYVQDQTSSDCKAF